MKYHSSKTYGHEIGLSCCFRQWRAESHCNLLHGYAISVHFEFEADELDARNWVVDFGGLKSLKAILQDNFDHRLIVAEDDPHLSKILELQKWGVAEVVVLPNVGCEKFAEYLFDVAAQWLIDAGFGPRVGLHHVTVREHGANSASYYGGRR